MYYLYVERPSDLGVYPFNDLYMAKEEARRAIHFDDTVVAAFVAKADTPTYVVVRWDADPWFLEQVDKCRIKNGLVN